MIRKTLTRTKEATFQVRSPSREPAHSGYPIPVGAGFFISKDGYFLTADHVVDYFEDIDKVWLDQPSTEFGRPPARLNHISVEKRWGNYDIAILKVDFHQNRKKEFFKGKKGFTYLLLDTNLCEEGTPVYSFAYPLSRPEIKGIGGPVMIATETHSPRVTSAIISSQQAYLGPVRSPEEPKFYAIDKALNYGNSGGPIISTETGKVVAVCSQFQPVSIPQPPKHKLPPIIIPSLYGVVSALWNVRNEIGTFFGDKKEKKIIKKERKKEFKPRRRKIFTADTD